VDLTSSELIARLAEKTQVKRDTVKIILSELGEAVQASLKAGGEVTLPGIGKLVSADRSARIGTNPKTGAKVEIAAKRVAKLKPSLELRNALI
jgi:DNA-binding protein HU-beta